MIPTQSALRVRFPYVPLLSLDYNRGIRVREALEASRKVLGCGSCLLWPHMSRGVGAGKPSNLFRTLARAQLRSCGVLLAGFAL